ncbi:MAG: 50S ribosomal protein L9 [Chloroflexi bacterium]|nr:50S ribosomal protein L9 [Chloroflexota bacterium]MCL5075662.1 50S ribosomal protein L9 [Chloroflexota bacterium]
MKVLLVQDVDKLGKAGEIKEVRDGYGRNFLLPRRLAVLATEAERKKVASQLDIEAKRQVKAARRSEELAERLSEITLVFKVKVGEQHRLYGSVTSADIAEALGRQIGQPINKRKIVLEEPIRHLGEYEVPVRLSKQSTPRVRLSVESEDKG